MLLCIPRMSLIPFSIFLFLTSLNYVAWIQLESKIVCIRIIYVELEYFLVQLEIRDRYTIIDVQDDWTSSKDQSRLIFSSFLRWFIVKNRVAYIYNRLFLGVVRGFMVKDHSFLFFFYKSFFIRCHYLILVSY